MRTLKKNLVLLLIVLLVCFLLFVDGCTLHFKATELEVETETNATYELESVDVFENNRVATGVNLSS